MIRRRKQILILLFLTLVVLTLVSSTDTCIGLNIYYRKNDYLKYRITGSIWVKAEFTNTTIVDKTPRTSYIDYYAHIVYTKQYNYTLREVAIVKRINKTYVLVRGDIFVSDIKLHYFNEYAYGSPPHIVRDVRISYIDFIVFSNIKREDLTIIDINDLYSKRSFELLVESGSSKSLETLLGLDTNSSKYNLLDKLLLELSNGSLIIVDPGFSSDYNLKLSVRAGGELRGDYLDLEYDVLLRYFNGVLIYGSIIIYGNRSRYFTTVSPVAKSECRDVSRILLFIEIELVDTSVEEIPTWRSLRVDLLYFFKSVNALENSLIVLFLTIIPIVSLYILYKKLTSRVR